jgi:pyrroline-5-carboxylate reductase
MNSHAHYKNLAILGCGNMGAAMARGVVGSKKWQASEVRIYDVKKEIADKLEEELWVYKAADITDLLCGANAVISAVKPQDFPAVAPALTEWADRDQVLVSIMAGLSTEKIKALTDGKYTVVRTMPNLGLSVSQGATAIEINGLPEGVLAGVEEIFSSVGGSTVRVMAEQMDAVTGLSGSGPMYLFEFMDALVKAGIEQGLEKSTSYTLAAQTVKGSLKLLEMGSETPEEWTKKVCSKGGTTLAALDVLNPRDFKGILQEAVKAATTRSGELGRQNNG